MLGTIWTSIPEDRRIHLVNTLTEETFRNYLLENGLIQINEVINNKNSSTDQ
jgi:hypothetical protein